MTLFTEIQADILGKEPISNILRKAKVLAYHLKNQEFKNWVEFELNGYFYSDGIIVPEYRKFKSPSYGDFMNLAWRATNAPIPLDSIPPELREIIGSVEMRQGVRELESMMNQISSSKETAIFKVPWPAEWLPYLTNSVFDSYYCISAWRILSRDHVAQILDTVRNRLLSFILELSDLYPDSVESDFINDELIPDDQIHKVFNIYIMGNNAQVVGSADAVLHNDKLTVFDQKNQHVGYQYNSARDINFDTVKDIIDFKVELEKLKRELEKATEAKVIDDDTAIDVNYKLAKVLQQSQKPKPDKKSMLENINSAITMLGGVSTAVALVADFIKAAELVRKFF